MKPGRCRKQMQWGLLSFHSYHKKCEEYRRWGSAWLRHKASAPLHLWNLSLLCLPCLLQPDFAMKINTFVLQCCYYQNNNPSVPPFLQTMCKNVSYYGTEGVEHMAKTVVFSHVLMRRKNIHFWQDAIWRTWEVPKTLLEQTRKYQVENHTMLKI